MERSILDWSIRALLMAIGTGLVVSTLRVRAASVRHRAWTAATVGMLLLPFWTTWGPSITAPILPAVHERAGIEVPERHILPMDAALPSMEASQPSVAAPFRSIPRPWRPSWQQILAALYLAGVAAMLTRLIWGLLQVRSMMRGVRPTEGVASSSRCAAPVSIGWLRPVLLLPDDWRTWPTAKLDAVLIHEREHVRRRDPLVQFLALLNRCVFWFHPLAWWLERNLTALAEEACDNAVLASGHAPHDYARYLIEMARSVSETEARIRWAGAVTFSSGALSQRIRRIMDAPPATDLPRAKSIASAIACALMLATFLACNLGRPTGRAPGQPAMSEQDRSLRGSLLQRQQQAQQRDEAVWKAARNLTPGSAKELDADVKAHPIDPDKLLELLRYYQSQKDLKALDAFTLWMIGQHPEIRSGWGHRPEWDTVWDREGYDRGRQLWTTQLEKSWDSPFVYMNAAEFLSGNDNEQAERILLEGQRRFPATGQYSGLHWDVFLARHYAWALRGSPGQLPDDRMAAPVDESGGAPAQGAYPQKIRETLAASKDTELLTRTVEQLQANRPNRELCRSLIERVLSIDPENRQAHLQLYGFHRNDVELHAETDPGSLSDSDRMVWMQSQLEPPRAVRADAKGTETKARELLALASRNTKDPNYGTAVFLAKMALGGAALNGGDRAEAVRYLLAASDAPPTEFLRYKQIDMSLARNLVDAGERESVAKFLDHCAKFNRANEPLTAWAAQIRKGLNPRLMPNFNAFRQAG